MAWQVVWVGLLMAAVTLATQAFAIHTGSDNWQTMVFTVLTLAQMWQVMAIRSEQPRCSSRASVTNLPLLGAVLLTFVLQLAVIYVPPLNPIFKTAPLTAAELMICIAMSSVVFVALEINKGLVRLLNTD